MNRDEAYKLMTDMIQNQNLRKHALAVEAIMGSLCGYLASQGQAWEPEEFKEEEWAVVGLLHDGDYEVTNKDPKKHTLIISEKLKNMGVSERIINAIQAHSDVIKPNRENTLEKAIFAVDELSGLITAVALVRPDKKLASVTVESVLKKFKEKSFAAGAKRENILTCENELGIPLRDFVGIGLEAMQDIADNLGL